MGRAGAFVAGADDLGAVFYNPAGIVHAKREFLADVGFMLFHTEFTRKSRVWQMDPNTGEPTGQSWDRTYETSKGSSQVLPIPTLALSYDFGIEDAAFALGMWSPYAAGARYEAKVAGKPNPGRYMLLNLDGSALVVPGIWGAYKIVPEVSVGGGIEMLMGQYRSESVLNSCLPDRWMLRIGRSRVRRGCAAPGRSDFRSERQLRRAHRTAPNRSYWWVVSTAFLGGCARDSASACSERRGLHRRLSAGRQGARGDELPVDCAHGGGVSAAALSG